MTALRWGIISTGGIARQFTADLLLNGHTVTAVGSRTQESADRFAAHFGLPAAHPSYEALVADPAVDIVYVATPHPGTSRTRRWRSTRASTCWSRSRSR